MKVDPEPKIVAPPQVSGGMFSEDFLDLSDLKTVATILERMVSQNIYDDIAQGD